MNWCRKWINAAASILIALAASVTFAQSNDASKKVEPARSEVPEGSPALPRDTTINQSTAETMVRERNDNRAESPQVHASEERIENRLAVIRSGRTTITDPNVGRYDRVGGNGQKRVTPTMWELLRF